MVLPIGYTGWKLDKSGFKRQLWVLSHWHMGGKSKRRNGQPFSGSMKRIRKFGIDLKTASLQMKEIQWKKQKEQRKWSEDNPAAQPGGVSNQCMSDNGTDEKRLVGNGPKRPLALALEEDLSMELWGQKEQWGEE